MRSKRKTEDGTGRAASVAAMEVLKQLHAGGGEVFQTLEVYCYAPVLNARQEKIGVIRPNFTLTPA